MSGRHYMSFGAGVQSTALAFLAVNQDPRLLAVTGGAVPEFWIFADTGDERAATYEHLESMQGLLGDALVIVRHTGGRSLSEFVLYKAETNQSGMACPPFFVPTNDGGAAPVQRSCTRDFKIIPIEREARARLGVKRGKLDPPGVQWIGISTDEAHRMKPSRVPWKTHFYPLVEMGWRRWHCLEYLREQTYAGGRAVAAVRSSCVYCPFHGSEEWRSVQADPRDWPRVRSFEERLHEMFDREGSLHFGGFKNKPYLHRSLRPIGSLDFDDKQGDLWGNECEGVCGV